MPSVARKTKALSSKPAGAVEHLTEAPDAMHAALVKRADDLMGCIEGSPEEAELVSIVEAIEAYEALWRPTGRVSDGKG
jgi:hypothetical protein